MSISEKIAFLSGARYDVVGWQEACHKLAPYGLGLMCSHARCARVATRATQDGVLCELCAEADQAASECVLCGNDEIASGEYFKFVVYGILTEQFYVVCSTPDDILARYYACALTLGAEKASGVQYDWAVGSIPEGELKK